MPKKEPRTKVLAVGFTGGARYELREFEDRNGRTMFQIARPDGNIVWMEGRFDTLAAASKALRVMTSDTLGASA